MSFRKASSSVRLSSDLNLANVSKASDPFGSLDKDALAAISDNPWVCWASRHPTLKFNRWDTDRRRISGGEIHVRSG